MTANEQTERIRELTFKYEREEITWPQFVMNVIAVLFHGFDEGKWKV